MLLCDRAPARHQDRLCGDRASSSHPLPAPEASAHHPRKPRPAPPNKLSEVEVDAVLSELRSERFVDCSPDQVYFTLLDEGTYIASVSSFYRILRANGEVKERRAQATHPAKVKPELVADGPNVCWSWDITKLKGPRRGDYFDLYVILDIFSRYVVAWYVSPSESGEQAKDSSPTPCSLTVLHRTS